MRFLGFLFLVALGIGGWGWHKGWFTASTSNDGSTTILNLQVHKDALARDLDTYEKKVHDGLDTLSRKIGELREKSKKASSETKSDIDRQIEELEKKKSEATESLNQLKGSAGDKSDELKKKIDEVLNDGK